MAKHLLFIYGTLQEIEVQKKVFGRMAKSNPDRLSGYKKEDIKTQDGGTYPIAIHNKGFFIDGSTIEVTDLELIMIDKYETNEYKRIVRILDSGRKAWVYVAPR